jgi:aminopeptidase YwaD
MRQAPVIRAAALIMLAAASAGAQSGPADKHLALVRPLYSGERALETVAFLDKFVRWPGNIGFDSSIAHVASRLAAAGYVEESHAKPTDRLTYRIEKYPMTAPAWRPVDASLSIVGLNGKRTLVLSFTPNRNMLQTNSWSTPAGGVDAELVRITENTPAALDAANVKGKIVWLDAAVARRGGGSIYVEAVAKRGALGTLSYSMPAYLQPEKHKNSIQFSGLPFDSTAKGFGIMLSPAAREMLASAVKAGPVKLHVNSQTVFTWPATELTVVAEIRGSVKPNERFVYSAHVQEPGANDNASGVGALTEAARVAAALVRSGKEDPKRTLTFLWGLEIRSTDRFINQDAERAKGILFGMSLDMVGEDTKKTGGTFLIEKMPDPSAIWTRGDDHHTEWGGSALTEDKMTPHFYNDFVIGRALDQAKGTGWVVKSNPFEGGSDHTPFLTAKKPGLLLWHFTDEFYHTDGDRLDKVSADELRNSGITALISGLTLTTADGATARAIVAEVERAALKRLETERAISADTIGRGASAEKEMHIIEVWGAWYRDALKTANEIEVGGTSAETQKAIDAAIARVGSATTKARNSLKRE